jgi:hypothetical protein
MRSLLLLVLSVCVASAATTNLYQLPTTNRLGSDTRLLVSEGTAVGQTKAAKWGHVLASQTNRLGGFFIYHNFATMPEGSLSSNFTTLSGHKCDIRTNVDSAPFSGVAVIEDGNLRPSTAHYGQTNNVNAVYFFLTVTNTRNYTIGIRYTHELRDNSGDANAGQLGFGCSSAAPGGGSFLTSAMHGGFQNGGNALGAGLEFLTNGLNSVIQIYKYANRPPGFTLPELTNQWHTAEIGYVGGNVFYASWDGFETNYYHWQGDTYWSTNLYFEFSPYAGPSPAKYRPKIAEVWVRPTPSPRHTVRTDTQGLKIVQTSAGNHFCSQSEYYIGVRHPTTNIFLPGGTWVGQPLDAGTREQPFQERVIIIKDESGAAASTNIFVNGWRYTNQWLNTSWQSVVVQDNIEGTTNKAITTAYGTLRLVCRGTNWFTW